MRTAAPLLLLQLLRPPRSEAEAEVEPASGGAGGTANDPLGAALHRVSSKLLLLSLREDDDNDGVEGGEGKATAEKAGAAAARLDAAAVGARDADEAAAAADLEGRNKDARLACALSLVGAVAPLTRACGAARSEEMLVALGAQITEEQVDDEQDSTQICNTTNIHTSCAYVFGIEHHNVRNASRMIQHLMRASLAHFRVQLCLRSWRSSTRHTRHSTCTRPA